MLPWLLAGALAAGGCRDGAEQARVEARDVGARRLASLADAWASGDCGAVSRLSAGFESKSPTRRAAVSYWLGRCRYAADDFVAARTVFDAAAATAAGSTEGAFGRRALYWSGRARYRLGDSGGADAALERFVERFTWDRDADDALYYRGKVRLRADDPEGALGHFSVLLAWGERASPFRRAGATLQSGRAEAALAASGIPGAEARARAWFRRVATTFPDSAYTDDAAYRDARLSAALGDAATAEGALARFEAEFPASSWRDGAGYHRGRALETLGRAAEAIALYEAFASDFPESPYLDNVDYRRGRVLFRLAEAADASDAPEAGTLYDAARAAFAAFLDRYPESSLSTGAAYHLGRSHQALGDGAAARAQYARVLEDDTSVYRDNAAYATGSSWYAEPGGRASALEAAIAAFASFLRAFPESSYVDDAAYFTARALYRLRRVTEAEAAFGAFVETYPQSSYVDNALYYLVLLRSAEGDCEGARAALNALRGLSTPSPYATEAASTVAACAGANR
jgi:TolA-binding protein